MKREKLREKRIGHIFLGKNHAGYKEKDVLSFLDDLEEEQRLKVKQLRLKNIESFKRFADAVQKYLGINVYQEMLKIFCDLQKEVQNDNIDKVFCGGAKQDKKSVVKRGKKK